MSYVAAGRFLETIRQRYSEFGLPFDLSTNIVSPDPSTLFVCAGMQLLKSRFEHPDGGSHGNIQYCIRTNDIDTVGDGTHLTFFQMLGSFGFGTNNYEAHIDLWIAILRDLQIHPDCVHVYPGWEHEQSWKRRGYIVQPDPECSWTDGTVGGYCSEMFYQGLELGNLVNPLGHSVDVGFGLERLYQVYCRQNRVDETDLFRSDLDPVSRDHFRTLTVFWEQGIEPGNKGRNYVSRRLMRRFMRRNPAAPSDCPFISWLDPERQRLELTLRGARKYYRRHQQITDPGFWWDTFGLLPDELDLLA